MDSSELVEWWFVRKKWLCSENSGVDRLVRDQVKKKSFAHLGPIFIMTVIVISHCTIYSLFVFFFFLINIVDLKFLN